MHQKCDVCKCFSRSNLILCIRLSKNLQACNSKRCDFKYKKLSRKVKNYAHNSMNFNFCLLSVTDVILGCVYLNSDRREIQAEPSSHQHSASSLSGMPKATVHCTKPGHINYNDIEVIARIEEVCSAVRSGTLPHLAAASLQFGINYGMLHNQYHKLHKPTKQAHEDEHLMNEEEAILVDWIQFLGMVGCPITRATLRPKCIELCGQMPGRMWLWCFLKHHPELKLK